MIKQALSQIKTKNGDPIDIQKVMELYAKLNNLPKALDITQSHFDKAPVFSASNQFIRPCIKCGFYGISLQSILNEVDPDNAQFVCESCENESDS